MCVVVVCGSSGCVVVVVLCNSVCGAFEDMANWQQVMCVVVVCGSSDGVVVVVCVGNNSCTVRTVDV